MRIHRKTTLYIFLVMGFSLKSAIAEQVDFQEFNPTERVFAEPLDPNQYGWVEDPSRLCKGFYHVPSWEVLAQDPKWEISADELEMIREGTSTLKGSVHLVYGQRHFFAKELEIFHVERTLKEIKAHSNLVYQDPDLKIQGSEGFWQAEKDIMVVFNPHYFYFPRHAHGSARKITIQEQRKLLLEGASYTTCPPNDPTWKLQGERIQLNRDTGMGQAHHIALRLKNVPIFYWPYLQFPIDNKRHTGFLYPNVGSTTQSGLELSWPFYWNIAPNYDATFTPRILTERGLDLQNELRYLSSIHSGIFQLHFLPGDQKYKEFRETNLLTPPFDMSPLDPRLQGLRHGNDRLGIRLQHITNFSKYWNLNIDYAYVSDDNYFYDLENDLNSASTNKLNQEVNLHYQNIHWQHWWRLQNIDSLHPLLGPITFEEYNRLPQWAFQGVYPKFARFFSFNLEGEATHFTHPNDPFTTHIVTNGERFYLKPALSLPIERIGGYFKPTIKIDYVGYNLNLSPEHEKLMFPDHANRVIPIYSLDTGLFFDKFYHNAYQHTLEPRVYYLYVPFHDQSHYPNFDSAILDFSYYQMFRDNRFTGKDRLGDTNQITLALTSRILNSEAEEKLRFTLGEIYYFKERQVTICELQDYECIERTNIDLDKHFSPIIGNLLYTPTSQWYFELGGEFNPNHVQMDKGYLSGHYVPGENKIININYYWMRRDPQQELNFLVETPLHQIDTSFYWPLHRQWDMLAQYRHDLEKNRMIELLGGLEYNSCCFAWQLVANRYLRPSDGLANAEYANGIFVQLMLKGLSTLGSNRADQKLKRSIPNYQPFSRKNRFGG